MTEFKLAAETREKSGNNKLRKEGFVPGIVYGKNFENSPISFDKVNFKRLFKEAGTSNLIDLTIGGGNAIKTLVHEVQTDPVNDHILHVDFFKVNMKEKIHADVPLEFVGDSVAIIEKEGSLITSKDTIEIECLPSDLIPELQVDISVLDDFEKNIKISDLKVPAGIEILDDPDEVVAFVQEPLSEEELAELEEEVKEDVEAVEVEHAGEEAPAEGEEGEAPDAASAKGGASVSARPSLDGGTPASE